MSTSAVIFDLDGTLVDSSPGILDAYAKAFASCGLEPVAPLTARVIGPPLRETLMQLSGRADPRTLDRLTDAFKAHYDSSGYLGTVPFSGVEVMLRELRAAGISTHVATNKRALPKAKIIDYLRWQIFFDSVNALDSESPSKKNKSELLLNLLAHLPIDPAQTVYVGDRYEDGLAAEASGLAFIWAKWGFDDVLSVCAERSRSWQHAFSTEQVVSYVRPCRFEPSMITDAC